MNFRDLPAWRKSLVILGVLIALPVVLGGFGAASSYFENRERAKAETAEYWRREQLTPEQRLAEDAAKARAAKAAAEAAQAAAAENERKVVLANGQRACLAAWRLALNDPDSAQLDSFDGVVLSKSEFQGQIIGRAKNAFGGYVRASWWCHGVLTGADVRVLRITQGAL